MSDEKPYKVRTTTGALHSEHKASEQAIAAAKSANEAAVKLGIAARYEANV